MNNITESKKNPVVLKIGSRTNMPNLVKAIIANIKKHGEAACDNMGPNATFLCNKALIYSANLLANEGIRIMFSPSLVDVEVENPNDCVRIKTALRWTIRIQSK